MNQEASNALLSIASRADIAREDAIRAFGKLGLSESATYCVAAIDYGYHDDETILNAYSAICMQEEFSDTVMCMYRQLVLMLVPEKLFQTDHFRKTFQAYVSRRSCRVGVSDSVVGFDELVYACDEAIACLEYGFFDGDIRIVRFSECRARYLAACKSNDSVLVSYCLQNSVLKIILDDDQLNGSNNFVVLKTFLDNDCRTSKASFILNIDKALLSNQIKNVQELYKFDLSDTKSREQIREELRLLLDSSNGE